MRVHLDGLLIELCGWLAFYFYSDDFIYEITLFSYLVRSKKTDHGHQLFQVIFTPFEILGQ